MSTGQKSESLLVDAAWLQEQLAAGAPVRILDVRTPAEFQEQHIDGSFNIPLDALQKHLGDLTQAHLDDVVVVCRSGQRAQMADELFHSAGFTSLKVLSGGMIQWQQCGGDVVQGQPKWELERQVRLVAGGIVLTSIVASTRWPKAKWVAGFIGAGLTFAAVSNTCGMGMALAKLPYNRSGADVAGAVSEFVAAG